MIALTGPVCVATSAKQVTAMSTCTFVFMYMYIYISLCQASSAILFTCMYLCCIICISYPNLGLHVILYNCYFVAFCPGPHGIRQAVPCTPALWQSPANTPSVPDTLRSMLQHKRALSHGCLWNRIASAYACALCIPSQVRPLVPHAQSGANTCCPWAHTRCPRHVDQLSLYACTTAFFSILLDLKQTKLIHSSFGACFSVGILPPLFWPTFHAPSF